MSDSPLDVGAILRRHAEAVQRGGLGLTVEQRQALRDLGACRTAALGGRIEQCSACGRCEYVYHSCRNRHCPKCQAAQRALWLQREAGSLLAVEYHHVVFTLPAAVNDLVPANPRLVYGLLFEAASAAVAELAAKAKHLGAQVGMVAVLHTWGQTLCLHPHLHVLATGGGLSCNAHGEIDEEPVWRSCRPGFFLPVRPLSRLLRGKFLAGLKQAHAHGQLRLPEQLSRPEAFPQWLLALGRQDWVVYSQPPCAGAEVVLAYLARYVHRVAISNGRLLAVSADEVTFNWKDYRDKGKEKALTLSGEEFVRRFLQHVLPRGFVRIRHYGLLVNRGRRAKLELSRHLLGWQQAAQAAAAGPADQGEPARRPCPACGQGQMEVVGGLPRQPAEEVGQPGSREDSS